jgi:hypothetical protein
MRQQRKKAKSMAYVLNKGGKPLMPTKRHGKAEYLLMDGKLRLQSLSLLQSSHCMKARNIRSR